MPKKTTKAVEKSAPRKLTYEELEKAAGELGARVIWALKFCKAQGGGMVLMSTREMQPDGSVKLVGDLETKWWQDYFMDALDAIGHRIDRKAFYAKKPAGKTKRKTH